MTSSETECPGCGGFADIYFLSSGAGTTGTVNENSVCVDVPDPPGSCTLFNNPVGRYNGYCCDQDNDGFARTSCGGNDCNDTPGTGPGSGYHINPNQQETCDGIDNNCRYGIDEGFDQDNDGFKTCAGDCNDNNANINPGASEVCEDGIDNDCSGGDASCPPTLCNWCYTDWDCDSGGCPTMNYWCDPNLMSCQPLTPILIDVNGNGFNLTDAAGGVQFDLNANGVLDSISWTSAGSDDAWLVLDRNNNGVIDNGTELFGNYSAQPSPPPGEEKNGFLALAEYDKMANGGNGNGRIGPGDAVYSQLRLWQDINHNGVSDASELRTLQDVGLRTIDLDYKQSRRFDEHGNWFKYRAKVRDSRGAQLGRWAWDVVLLKVSNP